MTTELREYISKCDVCLSHRNDQGKQPMQSHEFVARPWAKVAADLCEFEVVCLNSITSRAIIKELKAIFARFGVSDTLVTDNGPQFSSAEFSVFSRTWIFEHKTSSPAYPQSNGKAGGAVKTVKNLLQGARQLEHQSFKHS